MLEPNLSKRIPTHFTVSIQSILPQPTTSLHPSYPHSPNPPPISTMNPKPTTTAAAATTISHHPRPNPDPTTPTNTKSILETQFQSRKTKTHQGKDRKKAKPGSKHKELKDFHDGLDFRRLSLSSLPTNSGGGGGGGGGRRRSFSGATQVELRDIFANNGARVVSADMLPFMQIHAVGFARKTCDSLEKFNPKTLALTLKKEFDCSYGPAWHCIVGTSFGSFVTHSVGGFMYFSIDQKLYILLFKTTVQRANDG